MSEPHRFALRPRFYELDPYGHVNHSVYIQYFESARIDLLASVGYGLDSLLKQDLAMVVINVAARFLGSAGLHEDLVIETGCIETGRVKSRWAQRILRAESGEVLTTQIIDFATTNAAGVPRRAPAGLADAIAPFQVAEDWLGKTSPL